MKKTVVLGVGVVGIALLFGTWYMLKQKNTADVEKKAEEDVAEVVADINHSSISSLSFSIADQEVTFTQKDGSWKLNSDETFPVNSNELETLVLKFNPLEAVRTLTNVDNIGDYGMEAPSNIFRFVLEDGTEKTITLGDTNQGTNDDYVMTDADSSVVYTISSSLRSGIHDDLYDYALSEDIPSIAQDRVKEVEISSGGNTMRIVKEDDLWRVIRSAEAEKTAETVEAAETEETAADSKASEKSEEETVSEKLDSAVSDLLGFTYVSFVEHNCEDLSLYGLENPVTIRVIYSTSEPAISGKEADDKTEETKAEDDTTEKREKTAAEETGDFIFHVGSTDESGNYYVQQEGSTQVHTVPADTINNILTAIQV